MSENQDPDPSVSNAAAGSEITDTPNGESQDASSEEPREPRPRVFGKFAFFITVVPMLFYLTAMFFASYIETTRAHTRVKKQAHQYVLQSLAMLDGRLEQEYAGREADLDRLRNRWNLISLEDTIKREDWTAEDLQRIVGPIFDDNSRPDYLEKRDARRELKMLLKMKELEEKHKVRDVLSLSHRHFNNLNEPTDEELDSGDVSTDTASSTEWFPPDQTWYPATYCIRIAGTTILMLFAFPGYFKTKFKITWLSVVVGVVGIVAWIGLVELDRNFIHLGNYLAPHGREAFDPFHELKSDPTWMWQFMAIRFAGLVIVVPFIEEFFLRGWLMRYIDDPDWDEVPIGTAGTWAIAGVIGYGVMSHTGEPLAAAAWFGMVTWLYLKTQSIWDCVVAHGVTNLLLGIFVVYTGSWYLW